MNFWKPIINEASLPRDCPFLVSGLLPGCGKQNTKIIFYEKNHVDGCHGKIRPWCNIGWQGSYTYKELKLHDFTHYALIPPVPEAMNE